MLRPMPATPGSGQPRAGHLLIIGGAEDKLRQRQILARFVSLAGGADARVVVISTASSLGDEATDLYLSLFRQMGVIPKNAGDEKRNQQHGVDQKCYTDERALSRKVFFMRTGLD